MEPVLLILLAVGLAIGLRLVAGAMDSDRIESYMKQNGWTVIDRNWEPFGPGWFGTKNSRIYRVVYRDRDGDVREAHVKTSILSGVYLTEDRILERAEPPEPDRMTALETENERLRAKLRRLEQDG